MHGYNYVKFTAVYFLSVQIVSLAALVHYQFHMDKAPPQPPYQTHFCGE